MGTLDQGITELRIDARELLAADVTNVFLESGAQIQELVLNSATGTYDGAMILPAGPQTLFARAYSGPLLVGQSNPTGVNVEVGQVTRVLMRILDVTGSAPPVYGPILDSLTYPTTAQATTPVTFVAQVFAPSGSFLGYSWTSSCPDSTFGSPNSVVTSWSKPTPGACAITMVATSNGYSVSETFQIVVFPAGSGGGAVDVSAGFIHKPSLYLGFPELNCYVSPGSNSSCTMGIAPPAVPSYFVNVSSWGGSTPGTITISDDCGNYFGTDDTGPDYRLGHWLPPANNLVVCHLTASATSGDGITSTLSAAILVRPGATAPAQPPTIFGQLYSNFGCLFDSNLPFPADCGVVPAGSQATLYGNINWADGHPGSVLLFDSCGGGLIQPRNSFSLVSPWNLPALPGQFCTVTIRATNLLGEVREASAQYLLQ